MNSKFIKTFAVIVIIAAGMTACGQKKNVTTDDVSEKEMANIQETAAQEVTAQEIITQEIATEKEPEDDEYVLVNKYIPDIYVELMYATDNNFTGVRIYDFTDAYLRYGTVKKLANVQKELKEQGYSLKIWDAYRPFEAQQKLWEVYPDPNYVANPADGMKKHNLGGTVDITMVAADGSIIPMPTEFDDFQQQVQRRTRSISERTLKSKPWAYWYHKFFCELDSIHEDDKAAFWERSRFFHDMAEESVCYILNRANNPS